MPTNLFVFVALISLVLVVVVEVGVIRASREGSPV
jgi:hypothetical protein